MKFLQEEIIEIESIEENVVFVFGGNKRFHLGYLSGDKLFAINKNGEIKPIQANTVKPLIKTQFNSNQINVAMKNFDDKWFKEYKEKLLAVRPKYTAAILTPESGEKLYNEMKSIIPEGWTVNCHHMTINLGNPHELIQNMLNKKTELLVKGFEVSEEHSVIAVEVETELWSKNEFTHITVALDKENGAQAMNSNKIDKITPLNKPFTLNAFVDVVLNNGDTLFGSKTFKKQ